MIGNQNRLHVSSFILQEDDARKKITEVLGRKTGRFFLTRECAHAHERVIAIVDFSLGRSVGWLVGSVVNFRACAVNEFSIQLVRGRKLN